MADKDRYAGTVVTAAYKKATETRAESIAIQSEITKERFHEADNSKTVTIETVTSWLPLKADCEPFGRKWSPYCDSTDSKVTNLSRIRDALAKMPKSGFTPDSPLTDVKKHIVESKGFIPALVGAKSHIQERYDASHDHTKFEFRFASHEPEFGTGAVEADDPSDL